MNAIPRVVCLLLCALAMSGPSLAQPYPSKPVRMLLGFPAGASTDIGGRIVGTEMSKRLGQPVIVENRPGANGSIAADATIKAVPDGYTLNFGSVMNFHPVFVKNGSIDAGRQLTPVSNSMSGLWFLFASRKAPINSVQELVALAKSNPGKLNFASTASSTDMLAAMFGSLTGTTFTPIAYGGSAAKVGIALTNGEADFSFNSMATIRPYAQSVRGLLIGASARHPEFPEVPTAREAGLPKFENSAFNFGIWAPNGVPKDILDTLSAAAAAAVKAPEVSEQIRKIGLIPVGSTAEEQLRTFQAEAAFWIEAAKLANFQPQ
jgi:tripartite-type tricarboxylate transporter receptor subunit TctC